MTLITHFRNSKISVVAGDSKSSGLYSTIGVRKVYRVSDGIIGFYGCVANGFFNWLFASDENERLKFTINEAIQKYRENASDRNNYNKPFSIVISSFEKSELLTLPSNAQIDIPSETDCPESELSYIIRKQIFFSPTRNEYSIIDKSHNNKLEELFIKCFKEVYNYEFEIELIEGNEKLHRLLDLFFYKIHMDNELNKDVIGGPVNYHYLDLKKGIISDYRKGTEFNKR